MPNSHLGETKMFSVITHIKRATCQNLNIKRCCVRCMWGGCEFCSVSMERQPDFFLNRWSARYQWGHVTRGCFVNQRYLRDRPIIRSQDSEVVKCPTLLSPPCRRTCRSTPLLYIFCSQMEQNFSFKLFLPLFYDSRTFSPVVCRFQCCLSRDQPLLDFVFFEDKLNALWQTA